MAESSFFSDFWDKAAGVFREYASYDLQKTQYENAADTQKQIDIYEAERTSTKGTVSASGSNNTLLIVGGMLGLLILFVGIFK